MLRCRSLRSGVFLSSLVTCVVASIAISSPKAQTLQPLTLLPSNHHTTPTTPTTTSFKKGATNVTFSKVGNGTLIPGKTTPSTVVDNLIAILKGNVTFSMSKNLTDSKASKTGRNATDSLAPRTKDNEIEVVTSVTNNTAVLPWTKWSQKQGLVTLRSALVVSSTAQPTSKSKLLRSSMNGKSMFSMASAAKGSIPEDVEWEPLDDMERNGHVKNRTHDVSTGLPMVRDFIFRVKSSFANPSIPGHSPIPGHPANSETETPASKPANIAFVTKLRSPNRRPGVLDATQRPMAAITFISPSLVPNHTRSTSSGVTEQFFVGSDESSPVSTSILKLKHKPTSGSHFFVADQNGPMIPKPEMGDIKNLFPYVKPTNKTTAYIFNQPPEITVTTQIFSTTQKTDNNLISTELPSRVQHSSTISSLRITEAPHTTTENTIKSTIKANQTSPQQSKSKFNPSTERIWIPVAVSTPPPRTRPISNSNQMIIKTPTRLRPSSRPTLVKTSTPNASNATKVSLKYKDSYDTGYFDKIADPLSEALLSSDIMYANSENFGDNSVYAHTTVHAQPGLQHTTPAYVTLAWNNDNRKTTTRKSIMGTTYSTSAHPILISALVNGPDFTIYEDEIRGKPHVAPGHEFDGEYVHSEAPPSAQQAPVVFSEVSYDQTPHPVFITPATRRPAYIPPHKPPYTTVSTYVDASYGITEKPNYDTNVYQTNKPNYSTNQYQTKKPSYVSNAYQTNKPTYGSTTYNTNKPPQETYQTTKPNYGNSYPPTQMTDNSYQTLNPSNSNTYDSTKSPQYGAYETKKPNYGSYITTRKPSYQPTQPTYGSSYETVKPTYGGSFGPTTVSYGNSYKPTTVNTAYENMKPPTASYQAGRPPSGDSYQPTNPTYGETYEPKPPPPPSQPPPNYAEYSKPQASYAGYDKPQMLQPNYGNNDGKNRPTPSDYGQDGRPSGQSSPYSGDVPPPAQPNYSDYNKPGMTSPNYQNSNHKDQLKPSYYGQDEKYSGQPSSQAGVLPYTTIRSTYYGTETTINPYKATPDYYEGQKQSGPPPPYYTGEVPAPSLQPPIYYPSSPSPDRTYAPQSTYENKPQASYYDDANPNYSTTPYYKPQIQPSYYTNGNPNPSTPSYQVNGNPGYNAHPKPALSSYEGGQNQNPSGNYANNVKPSHSDGGMNPYPSDNYGGNSQPGYNNGGSNQYPVNNYGEVGKPPYNEGSASPSSSGSYAQGDQPAYNDGGSNQYTYGGGYAEGGKPAYNDGGSSQYPSGGYAESGQPAYNNGGSNQQPSGNTVQGLRPPQSANTITVPSEGGFTTNFPFLVGDEETGLDAAGLAALAAFLSTANSTDLDFEEESATEAHTTALRPGQNSATSAATNLRPFTSGSASSVAAFLLSLTSTTQAPNDPPQQANDGAQSQDGGGGGSNGTLQRLLLAIGISVIPTATIAVLVGLPALLMGRRRRDVSEGNNKERVAQLIDEVNASMEKYVSSLPEILTTEKGEELRQYCVDTLEKSGIIADGRPREWLKMRKPKKHDGLTWKKIFQHVRSFLPRLRFGIQTNETSSQRAKDVDEEHNKNESGVVYIPVNPDDLSSSWYIPSPMKRPGNTIKNRLHTTPLPPLPSSSLSSSSEEVEKQAELPIRGGSYFQELICRKIMSLLEDDEDELDSELEDIDSDVTHDVSKGVADYLPVSNTTGATNNTLPRVTHVASITVPNMEAATQLFQQGVISEVINNPNTTITEKLITTKNETDSSMKLAANDENLGQMQQGSFPVNGKENLIKVMDKEVNNIATEKGKTMPMEDINKAAPKENTILSDDDILPVKIDLNNKETKQSKTKSRGPLAVIVVYDKDNYTVSYLDRKLMKMQMNKTLNYKRQLISKQGDTVLDKTNRYEEIMLLTNQPPDLTVNNASTVDTSSMNAKTIAAKLTFSTTTSKPTQRPNTRFIANETEQQLPRSKPAVHKNQLPALDLSDNWKEFNRILSMLSQLSFNSSDEEDSAQNSVEFAPRELSKSGEQVTSSQSKIPLSAEKPNVHSLSWVARPRRDVNKSNAVSSDGDESESAQKMGSKHMSTPQETPYSQSHTISLKHRKKNNVTKIYNKLSRLNSTKSLKTAHFKLLESQRSNSVSSLLPLPKVPDNIHEGKLYIYHLLMSPKSPPEEVTTSAAIPLGLMHRTTSTEKPLLADSSQRPPALQLSQNSSWPRTTTVRSHTPTTTEPITTTVSNSRDSINTSSSLLNFAKDIRAVNPPIIAPVRILSPGHPIHPGPSVFQIPIQVENSTPEYMHILGSPIAWHLNPLAPLHQFSPYVPTSTTTPATTTNPKPYSNWFHPGWENWSYLPLQPSRPTETRPYQNPTAPANIWYTTNASQNNPGTKATAILSSVPPLAAINASSAAAAPTTINIYTIHGISSDFLPFIKNPATTPHKVGDDGYPTVAADFPTISQDYYDDDYGDVEYNFQPPPPPVVTKRPQSSPRPTRRPPNRRPTTRKPSRPRPTTSSDIFQDPPFFEATTKRIRPANIRPLPVPQVAGGCVDCQSTVSPPANPALIRPTKQPAQATKASFFDVLNQKLGLNAKGGLLPLFELGNLGFLGAWDPWANNQVWPGGDKRSMDTNNTQEGKAATRQPLITVSINNQTELKIRHPQIQKGRPRPIKRWPTNRRFRKVPQIVPSSIRKDSSIEAYEHSAQENNTAGDSREANPILLSEYKKKSRIPSKRRWRLHQNARRIPHNSSSNSSFRQVENIAAAPVNKTTELVNHEFGVSLPNDRKYRRRRLKPARRHARRGNVSNTTVQQVEKISVTDENRIHEPNSISTFNNTELV